MEAHYLQGRNAQNTSDRAHSAPSKSISLGFFPQHFCSGPEQTELTLAVEWDEL